MTVPQNSTLLNLSQLKYNYYETQFIKFIPKNFFWPRIVYIPTIYLLLLFIHVGHNKFTPHNCYKLINIMFVHSSYRRESQQSGGDLVMHVNIGLISFSAVLYYTVLYCILLYSTVLYCTIVYYSVLYCTILYYAVLYCIVTLIFFSYIFQFISS
jgi:hypothetical protein